MLTGILSQYSFSGCYCVPTVGKSKQIQCAETLRQISYSVLDSCVSGVKVMNFWNTERLFGTNTLEKE